MNDARQHEVERDPIDAPLSTAWPSPPALRTARLLLATLVRADAQALAELLAAERLHLAPWLPLGDRAAISALVRSWVLETAEGERVHWLVRAGEAIVGGVTLEHHARRGAVELSYWLCAAATRHGYAFEAAQALCDVALARAALLEIRCRADNARSVQLARQLGFVLDDARLAGEGRPQRWIADGSSLRAWRTVTAALGALTPRLGAEPGTLHVGVLSLRFGSVEDAPFVVIAGDVGPDGSFDGASCLAYNGAVALGTLATVRGRLQLRHGCPPESVTPPLLRLLADETQRLRALAAGGDGSIVLSDYYTG